MTGSDGPPPSGAAHRRTEVASHPDDPVARKLASARRATPLAAAATAAVGLPLLLVSATAYSTAAGLSASAAFTCAMATYILGPRVAAAAGLSVAVLVAVAHLAAANPVAAAVLAAVVAAAYAATALRGWHTGLVMVPVTVSFAIAEPPALPGERLSGALALLAASAVFGAVAIALTWAVGCGRGTDPPAPVPPGRTLIYAAMLAASAALTVTIAVNGSWSDAGAWLTMTPFIVIQPALGSGWRSSTGRAAGTVVGFAISYLVGLIATQDALSAAIAIAAAVVALLALRTGRDHWEYAAALTTAVVLLEGMDTAVGVADERRLLAVVLGIVVSLVVMGIAAPLYIRGAREDRFADSGPRRAEQRWPMALAVIVVAVLQIRLPEDFRWVDAGRVLYPAFLLVLLIVLVFGDPGRIDRDRPWLRVTTSVMLALITASTAASVVRLVMGILDQAPFAGAPQLLSIGGIIWVTNVIGFALWFWDLDDGGAAARALRGSTNRQAFVFPEMTMPERVQPGWYPQFVDYLALSFNTALAFSPTDVSAVRRWAKLMMIAESVVSLVLATMVLARAINII